MDNYSMDYAGIDLDWYALDLDKHIAHLMSGGGIVPNLLNEESHDLLTDYFNNLPEIKDNDVKISDQLNQYVNFSTKQEKERYLQNFIKMAQRGIYSYDKTNLTMFGDPMYHLVAIPGKFLTIGDLPLVIYEKLQLIPFKGKFRDTVSLTIEDIGK